MHHSLRTFYWSQNGSSTTESLVLWRAPSKPWPAQKHHLNHKPEMKLTSLKSDVAGCVVIEWFRSSCIERENIGLTRARQPAVTIRHGTAVILRLSVGSASMESGIQAAREQSRLWEVAQREAMATFSMAVKAFNRAVSEIEEGPAEMEFLSWM